MYISKLNPKYEALFQQPWRDWNESAITHDIWYENRPLGVNTLGNMMKEISSKAKLSKVYTNHCVRATAVTLCSEVGLVGSPHLSYFGPQNPEQSTTVYSSLQHNSRPSSTRLRKCSDVLSSALQENELQTAEVSATEVEAHSRSSST